MIRKEIVETNFKVETMARKDHMRFHCQECGDSYCITSRLERFLHWLNCSAVRLLNLWSTKVVSLFGARQRDISKQLKRARKQAK